MLAATDIEEQVDNADHCLSLDALEDLPVRPIIGDWIQDTSNICMTEILYKNAQLRKAGHVRQPKEKL